MKEVRQEESIDKDKRKCCWDKTRPQSSNSEEWGREEDPPKADGKEQPVVGEDPEK